MRGFHHIENVLSVVVMLFLAAIWGVGAAPRSRLGLRTRARAVRQGRPAARTGSVRGPAVG